MPLFSCLFSGQGSFWCSTEDKRNFLGNSENELENLDSLPVRQHQLCSCTGKMTILCLTSRTTVTSARIPDKDACHHARNLCVFSHVQNGTPGLTHKGCVLQRVSLGALSDVTVVLGMRQV